MKKTLRVLLTLLLLCTLSGCGGKSAYSKLDEFNPTKLSFTYGSTAVTESEDGLYYIYGNYLFFMDKETLESRVLCFKPQCLHYYEPDSFKIPKCDAFVTSVNGANFLGCYEGKLYLSCEDIMNTKKEVLIRMNLDGTGRETIIPDLSDVDILLMHLHRGSLYYPKSVRNEANEIGYAIVRRDITNQSAKEEVIFENYDKKNSVGQLLPLGNQIYFNNCIESEQDGVRTFRDELIAYNIQKGTTEKVTEDSYSIYGAYDKNLVLRKGKFFYCYDTAKKSITYIEGWLNRLQEEHPDWQCHAEMITPEFAMLSVYDAAAGDFISDWIAVDSDGNEVARIPGQSWNTRFHIVTEINGEQYLIICRPNSLCAPEVTEDYVEAYKISDLLQGKVEATYVLPPDPERTLSPGYSLYEAE